MLKVGDKKRKRERKAPKTYNLATMMDNPMNSLFFNNGNGNRIVSSGDNNGDGNIP